MLNESIGSKSSGISSGRGEEEGVVVAGGGATFMGGGSIDPVQVHGKTQANPSTLIVTAIGLFLIKYMKRTGEFVVRIGSSRAGPRRKPNKLELPATGILSSRSGLDITYKG
ncbi:hypothetical protein F2Q69_00063903 [Brassica cretica]|uniref:Uncharacterized protein n=1 Tax=Brassica cretica TaxID=69181 RepID=A0A8S9RG56_BRACR|nr:hypothetical protein F2Q69_00063903 [Brassica cretica]